MIKQEGRKFFNGLEIFAMLIASLCHDIDHPGNTNEFELKTLSPMALTHNDDAVLERHHCRVTFIILNHKSAQILQHFDKQRFKKIRQWILFCILSTDMAKHFEKFKQLENMTRRQLLNEKRFLFMGILIHAADLSYATLPFQQSFLWNEKLLDEFQNQAKNEKEQNLSTDFFMQNLHHQKRRFLVSIHLNSYVVRPFWFSLTSLCPSLRFYTDSLDQNIGLYKKELIKIQEKEEKEGPIYLEKNIRRMSGGIGSGSGRFFY
jgi:3',5'-cyclic-nucleotide phosphodiesterase